MVNIVVIDRTKKHSNRCVDNNDSQRINSFLYVSQCTLLLSKTMCQVVAYRSLKIIIENSKTVSRKIGLGRLREVVVYERFHYNRGTQQEYSSKPVQHGIVKRILVFKR